MASLMASSDSQINAVSPSSSTKSNGFSEASYWLSSGASSNPKAVEEETTVSDWAGCSEEGLVTDIFSLHLGQRMATLLSAGSFSSGTLKPAPHLSQVICILLSSLFLKQPF